MNHWDSNGFYRNKAVEHDTEDKRYWLNKGERKEISFVKHIVPKLKRNIIVHPEKENDPTYIDLWYVDKNVVADLKTQETPFFKASFYGYDPQITVTFNRKDYEHYIARFPEAIIFWWVNWKQLQYVDKNGEVYQVKPLYGVWEVEFKKMRTMIESGRVPLHQYQRRKYDPINAQDSFLFDLRDFTRIL